MATTIQVTERTRVLLEIAKKKIGAKSLDETLQRFLEERLNVQKSMFGKFKGKMKPFTRKERLEMWE